MIYDVIFSERAKKGIEALKRNELSSYQKLSKLLIELQKHPTSGTGHPKPLSGDRVGQWSRRITEKHRLVYEIDDNRIIVLVLTAYGHYDDK